MAISTWDPVSRTFIAHPDIGLQLTDEDLNAAIQSVLARASTATQAAITAALAGLGQVPTPTPSPGIQHQIFFPDGRPLAFSDGAPLSFFSL